MKTTLKNTSLV